MAALTALLQTALVGQGGLVLLTGEPGIGKSRMAEELAADAIARGVPVLWGRCDEDEGTPPFWPWMQILRAWLKGRDASTVRALMGPGAADLAALVPALRTLVPDLPDPPLLESADGRFRLFDSLATFLGQATDPALPGGIPHLLILDDLHWADAPSLQALVFLARQLPTMSLLVAGTYRDADVDRHHPLAGLFSQLGRVRGVQRLPLRALAPSDVAALLPSPTSAAAPTSDPGIWPPIGIAELAPVVHEVTAGNPLFIQETLRHLHDTGQISTSAATAALSASSTIDFATVGIPSGVQGVIRSRLARLSPASQRTLVVAATVGHAVDLPTLAGVVELGGLPLLETLDEAVRAGVIVEEPGPPPRYRFAHPLLRATLTDDLGAATRVRLHRQVGEALEAVYGAQVDAHLAELAWHFAQAAPGGEIEKAITYAERAAEQARRLYADEEAIRFYELALRLLALRLPVDDLRRAELLLALCQAQARAGLYAAADAAALEVVALARALRGRIGPGPAASLLMRATLSYGDSWLPMGAIDQRRIRLIEDTLAELEEGDHAMRARLQGRLTDMLMYDDPERRRAVSNAAVRNARRGDSPDALLAALTPRGSALLDFRFRDERAAVVAEALPLAVALGQHDAALRLHALGVEHALETGDRAGMEAAIAAYRELVEATRQPLGRWRVAMFAALRAQIDGRWAEAGGLAQQALALAERLGAAGSVQVSQVQVLNGLFEQEQYEALEAVIARLVLEQPEVPIWSCVQAFLLSQLGRKEEAQRIVDRLALDNLAALPPGYNQPLALSYLAEACVALGDARHAAILTTALMPYAGSAVVALTGVFWRGAVSHYLGLLAVTQARAGVSGDPTTEQQIASARQHFEAALAMHDRMGARAFLARTQTAYATLLMDQSHTPGDPRSAATRAGEQDRARVLATEALTTARELGLERLVARAEQVLITAAPAVSPAPSAGRPAPAAFPARLSAREMEVLRLLAAGRTNKEIAAALVLSPATVQTHTLHIYAKIGARGRADAVAFALRHGLAPV